MSAISTVESGPRAVQSLGCLRQVTGAERVVIPAFRSTRTIASAFPEVFSFVANDFLRPDVNIPLEVNSLDTSVRVCEPFRECSFEEMFGDFNPARYDELCLSQAHIVNFFLIPGVEQLLAKVEPITLFLLKVEDSFSVVKVCTLPSRKQEASMYPLSLLRNWKRITQIRVVVPCSLSPVPT